MKADTMRVQKFRSIDEMNAAQVLTSATSDVESFFRHCARYWAIAPRTYPRGVVRFRSVEEAQAARNVVSLGTATRVPAPRGIP